MLSERSLAAIHPQSGRPKPAARERQYVTARKDTAHSLYSLALTSGNRHWLNARRCPPSRVCHLFGHTVQQRRAADDDHAEIAA